MRYRCSPLLLLLFLAPACAPTDAPPGKPPSSAKPLVLLTDASTWTAADLEHYRDSLEQENYRVLVTGYPNETPAALTARLPWLLQPGVDLFIYDEALAGPAGTDSLRAALQRLGHEAELTVLRRP